MLLTAYRILGLSMWRTKDYIDSRVRPAYIWDYRTAESYPAQRHRSVCWFVAASMTPDSDLFGTLATNIPTRPSYQGFTMSRYIRQPYTSHADGTENSHMRFEAIAFAMDPPKMLSQV